MHDSNVEFKVYKYTHQCLYSIIGAKIPIRLLQLQLQSLLIITAKFHGKVS